MVTIVYNSLFIRCLLDGFLYTRTHEKGHPHEIATTARKPPDIVEQGLETDLRAASVEAAAGRWYLPVGLRGAVG